MMLSQNNSERNREPRTTEYTGHVMNVVGLVPRLNSRRQQK